MSCLKKFKNIFSTIPSTKTNSANQKAVVNNSNSKSSLNSFRFHWLCQLQLNSKCLKFISFYTVFFMILCFMLNATYRERVRKGRIEKLNIKKWLAVPAFSSNHTYKFFQEFLSHSTVRTKNVLIPTTTSLKQKSSVNVQKAFTCHTKWMKSRERKTFWKIQTDRKLK